MPNAMLKAPAAGVLVDFPRPANRANLTLAEIADAYLLDFTGRDPGRPGAVAFWVRELGARRCL